MSGGVDSSVAALILKNQDYEVIGVTMRLWSLDRDNVPKSNKRCCSVEDTDDAKSVCQILGIKHISWLSGLFATGNLYSKARSLISFFVYSPTGNNNLDNSF